VAHQLGSPRLSILAGIYDVNSEFDVIPKAGDFFNSSFGFGPEYDLGGPEGPSTYPATSLAMRLRWEPSPTLYGLVAVSDGVPGDQGNGRFSLSEQEGALVSVEVGYAEPLADVASASGAAAQPQGRRRRAAAQGETTGRPDDTAGLGIAYARNGDPFLRFRRLEGYAMDEAETVVELTYRAELGSVLLLQPNLQWIQNPGMNPEVNDALVLGLRLHVHVQYPGSD